MKQLVLALWHLSPIIPFVMGFYYLGIATLGIVLLPYIKVNKMKYQIDYLDSKPEDHAKEIESIQNAQIRWRYLTFLKSD